MYHFLKSVFNFFPYLLKKLQLWQLLNYPKSNNQLSISFWKRARSIILNIRAYQASSIYSHKNIIYEELQMGPEDFHFRNHYKVNCSGFVNHVLVAENHIAALREIREYIFSVNDRSCYRDSYYPRALTFVRFMNSKNEKKYWQSVRKVEDIKPGDIIAYARTLDKITKSGQHIMIANNLSKKNEENWVNISVFDSTGGHGQEDIRGEEGGLGEGVICMEMDKLGYPKKLKWSVNSEPFEATIAIGRLC